MTKKEENQQSSNINFKFKITKKDDLPGINSVPIKITLGLYKKLENGTKKVVYNKTGFSLETFQEALNDLYNKEKQKDEHRKKFNFRSKIFKQTYKFG